ncbi:MAG: TcpQ domain-containing protein [Betaproteobacteria bacterium]
MWTIFLRSLFFLSCLGLTACTKAWVDAGAQDQATAQSLSGKLDFGWRLSGDRSVAPLQIFSDASRTWLQWTPKQTLPALIGLDEQGERVLSYRQQGPYTVVEGHWSQLQFRAGRRQANARRLAVAPTISSAPTPLADAVPVIQKPVQTQPVASTSTYTVTPQDQHLRQALGRWASIGGWRFQPDHWVVDVDIPLTAGAEFTDDFIDSVRALVSATELSDRPLQPCFYSNRVLRVVPVSEHCDRTVEQGAPV